MLPAMIAYKIHLKEHTHTLYYYDEEVYNILYKEFQVKTALKLSYTVSQSASFICT